MAYLFSLIGGLCSLRDMGFLGNVIFGGTLAPAATSHPTNPPCRLDPVADYVPEATACTGPKMLSCPGNACHRAGAREDYPMAGHVLIAEDEANIAELLQFLLRQEGHETITVTDGQAALDAMRLSLPSVLVLDVMLPRLNGYEVLKSVRGDAALSAVPILMLTAKGQDKD
jgi:hypothetical protein